VENLNKDGVVTALALIGWLIRHNCPPDVAYFIARGFHAANLLIGY